MYLSHCGSHHVFTSKDVVIAKSRHLEVRQLTNSESDETASLQVVLSAPINGRITTMLPFRHPSSETDYIFFTTEAKQYAVISYVSPESADATAAYNVLTHASGDLADYGLAIRGNEPEMGPIAAIEPNHKCIALHLFEGFVTILSIRKSYRHNPSSSIRQPKKTDAFDFLGHPFHCRIEERDVCSMAFLLSNTTSSRYMPQLAFLHQDSRGNQHVVAHSIDLAEKSLVLHSAVSPLGSNDSKPAHPPLVQYRLKKSRVDGASGLIIAVPPARWKGNADEDAVTSGMRSNLGPEDDLLPFGGILVLGERQITYHDTAKNVTKILPTSQFLAITYAHVHPSVANASSEQDVVRYLLGDEEGRIHILAVVRNTNGEVSGLHLDTLGVTSISSSLLYLERGLVFVGSQTTDSQFIQILDKPVQISGGESDGNSSLLDGRNLTYINVLDEYTNLGPIVDFDMVPTSHHSYGVKNTTDRQCMAVTASGTHKDGSIRFVRNGVGLIEHAAVELGGIKGMWNVRKSFYDNDDAFLIQSYVGETRILGVVEEEESGEDSEDGGEAGATLAEVSISGFDETKTSLFAGNIMGDPSSDRTVIIQVTESEIRLISLIGSKCLASWSSPEGGAITIASANEAGQVVIVTRGGNLVYLEVKGTGQSFQIDVIMNKELGQEISCIDLSPFDSKTSSEKSAMDVEFSSSMEIDRDERPKNDIQKSKLVAVGLWDDCSVLILSLENSTPLKVHAQLDLSTNTSKQKGFETAGTGQKMVRSLSLVTIGSSAASNDRSLDMLFIGLGDGSLVSFTVGDTDDGQWFFTSRKDVSIGTRAVTLVPFENRSGRGGKCVLVTGDRPTVIYLSGGSARSSKNAKLCYSSIHLSSNDDEYDDAIGQPSKGSGPLVANVASPFHSSSLFGEYESENSGNYSLCISDDSYLRLGVIDSMEKLHVTTQKLGMAPRKVAYDEKSRMLCVACIDHGMTSNQNGPGGETNMGNCVRFFDDSSFEEIDRIDLNPYEMILSMIITRMRIDTDGSVSEAVNGKQAGEMDSCDGYRPYLVLGTGFGYPNEDEPSRGRIIVYQCKTGCSNNIFSRRVKQVAEVQVKGGVFSLCPFYNGTILASMNSKTRLCKLIGTPENHDVLDLKIVGAGHHGHIMSLHVKSLAQDHEDNPDTKNVEQLAIIGDMVRSISVVKYYTEFQTLEEVARDYNQNWVTAVEMLTDDIYLGAENFNNIFALQRNPRSSSEEIRCRLDTVGQFNLGEMINKFMRGGLVVLNHNSAASSLGAEEANVDSMSSDDTIGSPGYSPRIGSQTLFGTVDGTLGSIIGLDASTTAFFNALQKSIANVVQPIGKLKHSEFRSFRGQRSRQNSRGFIDGDLIESFPDLDSSIMSSIVEIMNKEGKWNITTTPSDNEDSANHGAKTVLTVDDVLSMVEDMSMMH